jgi:3',5'-cyclic-AMP phosphodiesterase
MSRQATQRLLQISDSHLFADPEGDLLGQRTRLTLERVLNLAWASHGDAERVLLTGDLSQDASPAAYLYLAERCARLGIPCHALPGNHDDPEEMARRLRDGPIDTPHHLDCGPWRLILLDSTLAGKESGHLTENALQRLAWALAARPQAPTLVILHHQPVPIGSPWLDEIGLDNPRDFFATLDLHPQVRGIVFGHIHQAFNTERRGVALLGAPSTCIQFLPNSLDFALDPATPGFRWLELHPDGRIVTGIERISAYPNPLDLSGAGY